MVIDYIWPAICRDQRSTVHREGKGRPRTGVEAQGCGWQDGQGPGCRGTKHQAELPGSPVRVGKGKVPGT